MLGPPLKRWHVRLKRAGDSVEFLLELPFGRATRPREISLAAARFCCRLASTSDLSFLVRLNRGGTIVRTHAVDLAPPIQRRRKSWVI